MENKNKSINEKELEILKYWKDNKVFEQSLKTPASKNPIGSFSFYDGPPFATGLPHHGHLLASTIKDAIPRFQTMKGKSVRRVWGWDCHGLPIENLIEKKHNLNSKKDIEEFGIEKFNKEAKESVFTYEKEWKEIIPRFGRWIDMENSYKTMDTSYMESVWWVFSELAKKDLVFEGYKSMHICPRCETTLAQSEVALGYKDLTDISVTAKFELEDEPRTFVLAWTTTPWTLPGNVALAVGKELEYVKVKTEKEEIFILAKERIEEVFKNTEIKYEILEEFLGEKLVGKKYKPVFDYYLEIDLENKENLYTIVEANFVTLETGTGVVHIAPAFGEDDLNLGKEKSLPIIKHVSMNGEFTKEVKDFVGLKVKKADDNQSADIAILKYLSEKNLIFSKEKLVHAYPTCWRCDTPLLNYATSSWFINVPNIKEGLLKENSKINWVPENIKEGRFGKWLEGAREWAVSRSRYWGAPLPIWKEEGGEEIKIISSLKELAENNIAKPKNEYYFMRHAEAFHNVEGVQESSPDDENILTEKGLGQVKLAKEENKIDFDIIVSSPFIRTKMTAEIMAGENKDKIIIKDEFKEMDFGTFDGLTEKELRDHYGNRFLKFSTRFGGGETRHDVAARMMKGILDLEKEYENKKILIVSHATPIQVALGSAGLITEEEITNDYLSQNPKYYPKNAEILKVDLKIVPRDNTGDISLHRPYIDEVVLKSKNGKDMKRVEYVFDCWFESGAMPYAEYHYPFENKDLFQESFPAEFIAEGLDQTRGWFYSLLNIGVGMLEKSPYKNVIVNGLLLAADGEKMSKSKNNYTDPMELVEKYGADAFRLTLLSSPVVNGESISFLDKSVEETYKKVISKLENVLSFYEMLDNVEIVEKEITNPIDIWIFTRLNELISNVTKFTEEYKLDKATRGFEKFVDDLSTWWLRRSRERLKSDNLEESSLAKYVLYKTLIELSKTIAPFMPFLSERIYNSLNNGIDKKLSVHLESWPEEFLEIKEEVLKEMEEVREIVTEALMIRQKNSLPVRQPLATLFLKKNIAEKYFEILKEEINVKEALFNKDKNYEENANIILDLNLTEELKKEGSYRELLRKIKDTRKENNLTTNDTVNLLIKIEKEKLELIKSFSEELKRDCKISNLELEESDTEEFLVKN